MYAHHHKSYKDSQTMTLVRKLRVHPCSKSLLEVESKECFHLVGMCMCVLVGWGFRTMHLCWLSPVPKMCTVLNLCLWGPSLIIPTRWSMGWASRQLAGPSWTVQDLLSAVASKLTHHLSPLHSLSFLTHSITLASSLILTRYHSLTLLPPSFCLFRL